MLNDLMQLPPHINRIRPSLSYQDIEISIAGQQAAKRGLDLT